MNAGKDHHIDLPVKGSLSLIYAISILIAILLAAVSLASLLYPALIYPTEDLIQIFVSNDAVNFFIGLPILLGSICLAWRGKLIGLLCWTGALFFVLYNYLAYIYAMPLNWAFFVHLVLTMLSLYALIGLITSINGSAVQQKLEGAVPERLAGGVLVALGLLFFLRVIGVVVNALSGGTLPSKTEFAVNVSDFLTTPAWVIGGILLWRRKEIGYLAGLGLLFQGSMLFIALIIFLLLQPFLSAIPFEIADVVVIFMLGLVCFVPFALFVRGVVKHHPNRQ